ncbi:uncharacterized protein PFL1_05430 [Pseudozyma flocculosa PF-1]|uniref:Uncharacterized protein n=2 Tax=Pseudozyma flocculosa TaxID=84751 RepID=A0A5C3FAL8_9BASI|nr:uncharacterized protein PFL1_05430 [Pseudozyma flocculosa PF-1]EPQ27149.1 hypothetical protein PFL1_05430 [Pseudozyma flocculosa PF-1]SPO41270.1 uncharacterized protein PSFLO_06752 [Pseudozyma flocculosa]
MTSNVGQASAAEAAAPSRHTWTPASGEDLEKWLKKHKPTRTANDDDGGRVTVESPNLGRSSLVKHNDPAARQRVLEQACAAVDKAVKEHERIKTDDSIPVRTSKAKGQSKKVHREQVERELSNALIEFGTSSPQWLGGKWMSHDRERFVDSMFAKLARSVVSGPLSQLKGGPIVTKVTAEHVRHLETTRPRSGSTSKKGQHYHHDDDDDNREFLLCIHFESTWNSSHAKAVFEALAREHGVLPTSCKADLYTEVGISSKHPCGIRSTVFSSNDFYSKAEQYAMRKEYHTRSRGEEPEEHIIQSVAHGDDSGEEGFVEVGAPPVAREVQPAQPVEASEPSVALVEEPEVVKEPEIVERPADELPRVEDVSQEQPIGGPGPGLVEEAPAALPPTEGKDDTALGEASSIETRDRPRSASPSPETMRPDEGEEDEASSAASREASVVMGGEEGAKTSLQPQISAPGMQASQLETQSSEEEMVLDLRPPSARAAAEASIPKDGERQSETPAGQVEAGPGLEQKPAPVIEAEAVAAEPVHEEAPVVVKEQAEDQVEKQAHEQAEEQAREQAGEQAREQAGEQVREQAPGEVRAEPTTSKEPAEARAEEAAPEREGVEAKAGQETAQGLAAEPEPAQNKTAEGESKEPEATTTTVQGKSGGPTVEGKSDGPTVEEVAEERPSGDGEVTDEAIEKGGPFVPLPLGIVEEVEPPRLDESQDIRVLAAEHAEQLALGSDEAAGEAPGEGKEAIEVPHLVPEKRSADDVGSELSGETAADTGGDSKNGGRSKKARSSDDVEPEVLAASKDDDASSVTATEAS